MNYMVQIKYDNEYIQLLKIKYYIKKKLFLMIDLLFQV